MSNAEKLNDDTTSRLSPCSIAGGGGEVTVGVWVVAVGAEVPSAFGATDGAEVGGGVASELGASSTAVGV